MLGRIPVLCIVAQVWLCAQSTQSLIRGRIVDSLSGQGIPGARIAAFSRDTNLTQSADADRAGFFALPLLSPGTYRLRVTAPGYQAQQVDELVLPVAAVLAISFPLRPLHDVWEQHQERSVFLPGKSLLPFYGPDVDTSRTMRVRIEWGKLSALESGMSHVVDPAQLRDLPLAGRDVYALLVTLPAVTTDTSTGRGLGMSAAGARPSASSFLLDGVENNNALVTGPLLPLAPEAVQEYRITTNGFSAEYGRTSGLLANAVTRPGGNTWHGLAYFYGKNDLLNANEFQRNRQGLPCRPLKEIQPGFSAAGPLVPDRLFLSASLEYLRFRSESDQVTARMPGGRFSPRPGTYAEQLWRDYPSRPVPAADALIGPVEFRPPTALNRVLVLPRADFHFRQSRHRIFLRSAFEDLERPEFIWSPYPAFSSPLLETAAAPAAGYLGALRPNLAVEARAAWTLNDLRFDRAHPEVPTMLSADQVSLPGSPASYSFRNRSRNWEGLANLLWTGRRHFLKAGAGTLRRSLNGYLSMGADGHYSFESLDDFGADRPVLVRVALSRRVFQSGRYLPPEFAREYDNAQYHFFVQETFLPTPRLTINLGLRYENLGAPRNHGGASDVLLALGPGESWTDRLRGGTLIEAARGQPLYTPDTNDWAPRVGVAYSLRDNARSLLRASYGLFFDRPFDNLWQNVRNNAFVLSTAFTSLPTVAPIRNIYEKLSGLEPDLNFSRLTFFDERLRTPAVHSFFAGLEHQVGANLSLEIQGAGSRGRDLIATDVINRLRSVLSADGRRWEPFRADLPRIWYRSNLGRSDYHGLTLAARYRTYRGQARLSYTWSHNIDNQSEPLSGDFFDLLPTRAGAGRGSPLLSAFSQQFNPSIDRGNSDFDQRHNLVFFSIWDVPPLWSGTKLARWTRRWKFAQLLAVRSGFPFTILSAAAGSAAAWPSLENRRADVVDPQAVLAQRAFVDGGAQVLNPTGFAPSPASRQGNSGRNALASPGYYTLDVSLARAFSMPRLGESAQLTLRADAFNILNHANLDTPATEFGARDFGQSLFGRSGKPSVFPALTPFVEMPRQIQLLLRLEF